MDEARAIIARLELAPHPEGGWYRETWRAPPGPDGRARGTAIHFLLERGQRSHWHRVDADEWWLWHAGSPLILHIADAADRDPAIRRLCAPVPGPGESLAGDRSAARMGAGELYRRSGL